MATKSTAAFPAFGQLQDSIHGLQTRAGELIERARKEAGRWMGKDGRKRIDQFLNQAQAFPTDLQKRAAKAWKSLETRASELLTDIRTQSSKRLDPLMSRFSVPSKHEVELLGKRLSSLEKKFEDLLNARR